VIYPRINSSFLIDIAMWRRYCNENVIIYANVSNVGTYQAENIGVEFYIDDILINNTMISSISNKSSIMVTSDWTAEGNGSHVVKINTLFSGYELNKTNNVATRGLVVGQETVPPSSVTNLHNITYASSYINWTWTDPQDLDFAKVMVYLDGVFKDNVTKGIQYYNATVAPGTYTIGTRTVDVSGNINSTMVTNTSTTILPAIRYINGTVIDSVNKTNIPGVKVSTNTNLSTTTNASGFYSFAVTSGTYNLTATFDIRYYTNSTTVSTTGKAVVMQDIELVKKPTGNITGSVTSI
jgi:hypothetical protein